MLKIATVVLLLSASIQSRPESLEKGPEPGEGESHDDKKQSKRQFLLSPLAPQPYPYIPIYVPYQQVVEVHHVVMLHPPACSPQQPGQQPPYGQPTPPPYLPPYQPPTSPPYQPPVQPTSPPYQPPPPQPTSPPYQPPPPQPTDDLGDRSGMNATAPKRPSRCVWAIVACCSPDSNSIRYSCFELLGCPGSFWGVNPCDKRVVQAAANTALEFYMSGGTDDGTLNNNSV